jgi:hypothetical protein
MTDRKFHYREFVIRVVSPEPVKSVDDLQRVLNGEQMGVWCSREPQPKRRLDGRETAVMLRGMGATPDLFDLDSQGDDLKTP